MEFSGAQEGDVVSVAVDAMAMNLDRSCRATKPSDWIFAYYAQPIGRPKKRLALRLSVMPQGKQNLTSSAFLMTFARHFLIKTLKFDMYICSDGDSGDNKRHYEFFKK
jgi:hypothetical protein